jgi:hypothetical protein
VNVAGRDRAWIFVLLIGVEGEVEGDAVRKPASNERAVDVLRAVVGIVDPGDLPAIDVALTRAELTERVASESRGQREDPPAAPHAAKHSRVLSPAKRRTSQISKLHQQRRMRRSIAEY